MELCCCAIISHHPKRFKWKYKESNNGCKRLKKRLNGQIVALYAQGVRRFIVGGGLGMDQWAGEMILSLKKQPEYSEIELVTALPYPGHDSQWDNRSRARLAFLIQNSTKSITVSSTRLINTTSFRIRDKYMVDHADYLLAVYDNDRTVQNQVGAAVRYAEESGTQIIFIHPDTGVVSFKLNTCADSVI